MRKLHGTELKDYFKDLDGVTSWWRPEEGNFQFWHQQELKILDEYFPIRGSPLVLDAACGQARFARYFASKGCHVHCLDINPKMIETACASAQEAGVADRLEFFQGDVETFSNPGVSYDVLSCMDALEHMTDLDLAVRNLAGMIKKGGHFHHQLHVHGICLWQAPPPLYALRLQLETRRRRHRPDVHLQALQVGAR